MIEHQENPIPPDLMVENSPNIPQTPGLRAYPSLTTVVFLLILISAIAVFVPFGITQPFLVQNLLSWSWFLLMILAGLRWFLADPKILIRKYEMKPLEEITPEVSILIQRYAAGLGFKRPPLTFYTNNINQRVMSFGTFRHNFIVLNTREIEAYRNLRAEPAGPRQRSFDVILVHELAHLRNGDNWKYRLSKNIVWIALVLSIVLVLSIATNTLSQKAILTGAPMQQAEMLANLLLIFVIQAVLFYMTGLLGRVRELYADAQAMEIFDADQVLIALEWYASVWANSGAQKNRQAIPGFQPAAGTAFLSKDNLLAYRQQSLEESVFSHRSQLEVLFAGGLAVGTNFAYISNMGLEGIMFGTSLLAVFLGLIYLLPFTRLASRITLAAILRAFTAAGIFSIGTLVSGLVLTLTHLIIQALLGVPLEAILYELRFFASAYGYALLSGLILALALAGTIPVLVLCEKGMEKGLLPRSWSSWLIIVPAGHALAIYTLIDLALLLGLMGLNSAVQARTIEQTLGLLQYGLGGGILFVEILLLEALLRFARRYPKEMKGDQA